MLKIDKYLQRAGMSKADVLRLIGEKPNSSILPAYESGRSNPSYEKCFQLLMNGMSIDELFGDEIANKVREYYRNIERTTAPEKPRDIVLQGLKAIVYELENKPDETDLDLNLNLTKP